MTATTDQNARVRALIGDPPVLPLSLAAQVAWSSIRVRLTRSLVTISSVVLAVAFLLTVIGEDLANRAVHQRYRAASLAEDQAQILRDVLARPRPALTLIGLLADQNEAVRAWARGLAKREVPAIETASAIQALILARWVLRLKPTQIYLVTKNRDVLDWLLDLDTTAKVDAFIQVGKTFKGLRLPYEQAQLAALAGRMSVLRDAVAVLQQAETRRLEQVAAAGGGEAVLELVRTSADADADQLTQAGLPLAQILPGLDAPQAAALKLQLQLNRIRVQAVNILKECNNLDPSLLQAEDILDAKAFTARLGQMLQDQANNPAQRLVAVGATMTTADVAGAADEPQALARLLVALNGALARPDLYEEKAWTAFPPTAEAKELLKQNLLRMSERRLTRLNRLLLEAAFGPAIAQRPGIGAFDLRMIADGTISSLPAAAKAKDRLVAGIGADGLAALAQELRHRADLATLNQTFTDMAYHPAEGGTRTFWLVVLSLLVCVVGIVNTMMMAVTERFREIATMKCLGAMDSFILKAFLIESAAMGLVGSCLGLAVGLIIVLAQAQVRFGAAFWSALPAGDLGLASLFALGCGLVLAVLGALLPALKAAKMHPIEAMRVDA